jgi:hypothetical protein
MMFYSDKAEKVGPKVAGKVGKELGIAPPPFEAVTEGRFRAGSLGGMLGDLGTSLIGGTRPLVTVNLAVPAPKPFELTVHVIKAGKVVALGSLLYSIRLAKSVPGSVTLQDAKLFGKSKVTGGNGVADKLNANSDLVKQVNRFVRTHYKVGDETIRGTRFLKIDPIPEGGSVLAINTLPRAKWFGLTSTFDAPAFLAIAQQIEGLL